ncbi:MAG: ABC transporter ATP-binding protein [Acidobacteria bacterium]|nr:ABC transporter ATP-binding protein [Acidobacteriota bacterium]
MTSLEFRRVSKRYGDRAVVSDLSFQIQAGERVVLHGPSGCGKTTVLRLLAGFLAPDEGAVLIDGTQVAAQGKVWVEPEHRRLGMVFQDLALWPHLTVYENLEFGLKAAGLPSDARRARIEDTLARVRLSECAQAYPTRLSGGQQQRVAVARALATRPLALLMDEPLSNLDDELQDELCDQILDLHAQLGFTLVYVTHSKEEMRRIAARAIRIGFSR